MKIPLGSKGSTPCGGPTASVGSSWCLPVVVGGEGGEFMVWVRVYEKRGRRIMFFSLLNIFVTPLNSPGRNFARLGKLAQLKLAKGCF